MASYLIKNVSVVNEGRIAMCDVLVVDEFIRQVASANSISETSAQQVIDGTGKFLFPGAIDDQVHFREPGLTHKGEIYTEAKAAVAGGVTSYMEMPNTVPNALTQKLLEEKYQRASEVSLANYSFFMGAGNDNIDEVVKTNPRNVCGVKIFMGSSTGSMLVDNSDALEAIFTESPILIATHCEDEATIRANLEKFKKEFGDDILPRHHPLIRSEEACYKSSSFAVELATKHNSRLHILHISTARETNLFRNDIPLREKRITAEACIHHLWFCDEDYETKGNFIKWNPAIKKARDREAIFNAVLENKIDVIATDHSPHTIDEKLQRYASAPSGGPLVQHSMVAMLEFFHKGKISLERIAEKMSHAVAECFQIEKRGFIREGFFADLVLVNLQQSWTVSKENILYKCGWSPFEGITFNSQIEKTFVSGHLAYDNGIFDESQKGKRMMFDR
ncbi:MAG: dihydroorotase [Flavobacteriales bacterium]|nr:dihydroorotase [Flavobacteriales bacterium]